MHTPIKCKITGTRPLLMHSDRFADPLDPMAKAHKALTSKRKKTDDDFEAIALSEWRGGLYYDETDGPYLPGEMIQASIIGGAKLFKMGPTIKRVVEVSELRCPLKYDGPRDPESMWESGMYDARSVKVGTARVMRYRPIFHKWSTDFTVMFDEGEMNREELVRCIEQAGAMVGLGDYRPRFGRYEVEIA